MSRSRRVVCLFLALCAVLAVGAVSCGRAEEREAAARRGSGNARARPGERREAIGRLREVASTDPWLQREIRKARKLVVKVRDLVVSHPGVWLSLLAFGAVLVVVALVRAVRRGEANACVEAAAALADEGKLEEACEMFAEAVRANPRDDQAWADWASALAERGRYREACEKLRRAFEFRSEYAYFTDERGALWEEMAQYQEACEKHARAVEANPQDASAYLGWGEALGKLGRHDEAFEKFAAASDIRPQDAEVYTQWAVGLARLGRDDEACERFARADETGRLSAVGYMTWAEVLVRRGQQAEAREKLNCAVRLKPALRTQAAQIRSQLQGEA